MAAEIARMFTEEVRQYDPPWRGGVFGVSFQGLTANVPEGKMTGATPDGRKSGDALADNISPQAGTDVSGPTAVTLSVSKSISRVSQWESAQSASFTHRSSW